jgi:hypothetical protein
VIRMGSVYRLSEIRSQSHQNDQNDEIQNLPQDQLMKANPDIARLSRLIALSLYNMFFCSRILKV